MHTLNFSVHFNCIGSVPDPEDVLKEADVKLEGVRQKIGLIAEELRGEDIYQFHRAFTPGEFLYIWQTTGMGVHVTAVRARSENKTKKTTMPST